MNRKLRVRVTIELAERLAMNQLAEAVVEHHLRHRFVEAAGYAFFVQHQGQSEAADATTDDQNIHVKRHRQ